MPRIIMNRAFIGRWTRMPHSTGRLSASASSHHSLSSAAFITNIAESDFRYTQDGARQLPLLDALALNEKGRPCHNVYNVPLHTRGRGQAVAASRGATVSGPNGEIGRLCLYGVFDRRPPLSPQR